MHQIYAVLLVLLKLLFYKCWQIPPRNALLWGLPLYFFYFTIFLMTLSQFTVFPEISMFLKTVGLLLVLFSPFLNISCISLGGFIHSHGFNYNVQDLSPDFLLNFYPKHPTTYQGNLQGCRMNFKRICRKCLFPSQTSSS